MSSMISLISKRVSDYPRLGLAAGVLFGDSKESIRF